MGKLNTIICQELIKSHNKTKKNTMMRICYEIQGKWYTIKRSLTSNQSEWLGGMEGVFVDLPIYHTDGLVQDRRNSSALRLSCTNQSNCVLDFNRCGNLTIENVGLYSHWQHFFLEHFRLTKPIVSRSVTYGWCELMINTTKQNMTIPCAYFTNKILISIQL